MSILDILSLAGGLALFLFGMNIMGTGLIKKSGSRLKGLLEKLTSGPIRGILLGAGVTAVIQSSSATTVMVIGFVNSHLMKLSQAIGVVMGANIGTTITAWLLSLIGLEGDSIFIQLLKPSSFTPVFAVIGIILYMFIKDNRKKDTGMILMGFSILMFGMEMMSTSVSVLAENPDFVKILTIFSNPFFGILAGTVITAILQSSSASVGILQAFSATGSLHFSMALPIIMGQNIGACMPTFLSAIGANKDAKRVAVIRLAFTLIGTLFFMIVYYGLHLFLDFSFADKAVNAFEIAIIHSVFNLVTTVVLLPFRTQLEKLSHFLVKDSAEEAEPQMLLDERLISTPSLSIQQCQRMASDMAHMAQDSLLLAMRLIKEYSADGAKSILKKEDQIDKMEDVLGTFLVKMGRLSLTEKDGNEVSKLLHCIGDFERIGDHAVNIMETAQEIYEKKIVFSESARHEIAVMEAALREILNLMVTTFDTGDIHIAVKIEPLEQVVDNLKIQLKSQHVSRLTKGECTIDTGFVFNDLINNFERVADHCSNIGICLIEISRSSFDMHEYTSHITAKNSPEFRQQYETYERRYAI